MSSSTSSSSSEDLDSDIGFSTDLGSTLPTREDDLTLEGTSTTQQQREDEFTTSGVVVDTEADGIAIALPPPESDGAGEYQEVALTGSAALDVLDQVVRRLRMNTGFLERVVILRGDTCMRPTYNII